MPLEANMAGCGAMLAFARAADHARLSTDDGCYKNDIADALYMPASGTIHQKMGELPYA